MKKLYLSLILALFFTVPFLTQTVLAENVLSYSVSSDTYVPSASSHFIDIVRCTVSGDAAPPQLDLNSEDGIQTVTAPISSAQSSDCSVTFDLTLSDDLSEYSELSFGIMFAYGENPSSPIRLKSELWGAGEPVFSQTIITEPENGYYEKWHTISLDISEMEGRKKASSLAVTVLFDSDSAPAAVSIAGPCALSGRASGFVTAEKFLTNRFYAEEGHVGKSSGVVKPENETGNALIRGDFTLIELPEYGTDAYFEISLTGVSSGGLTLGIEYASEYADIVSEQTSYKNTVYYSKRISLTPIDGLQEQKYAIPFTVSGEMSGFRLSFDGIDSASSFRINGIRLHLKKPLPEYGNSHGGRVNSLKLSDRAVTFSGELDRSAARAYSGGSLHFFAIPSWSFDDITTAVDLGSTKISTRFDYTAELSAYPYISDTFMYFAGVITQDGILVPISSPSFADSGKAPSSEISNLGLHGASAVGVFEANASQAIVDIDLDVLLSDDSSEDSEKNRTSLSYRLYGIEEGSEAASNRLEVTSKRVALNHSLLASVDEDVSFYISAGVKVYLRLLLPADNRIADSLTSLADNGEAAQLYAALIRFLCRRYSGSSQINESGIAGMIIGDSINSTDCEGELMQYADSIARLSRITYNAAKRLGKEPAVILPIRDYTEGEEYTDPRPLSVILSERAADEDTPWFIMYATEGAGANDIPACLRVMLNELSSPAPAGYMYFYEPHYDVLLGEYRLKHPDGDIPFNEFLAIWFTDICAAVSSKSVFLSLDGISEGISYDFYSSLKKHGNHIGGKSPRLVSDFTAVRSDEITAYEAYTGKYVICDFTNSFDPQSWVAVGEIASCRTVYSDLFTEYLSTERSARVLRTLVSGSESGNGSGNAGIIISNLSQITDMSAVDMLEFTISASVGEGGEPSTESSTYESPSPSDEKLVFVIGSDDCRAEFTAERVTQGNVSRYICDISSYEYRYAVDYLGIIAYADRGLSLDLSSVKAYSRSASSAELSEIFTTPVKQDKKKNTALAAAVCAAIITAVSVCAAVMLIRHDIEAERETKAQSAKEIKYERKRQ